MRTPRPLALALVSMALLAGAAGCSSDGGSEGATTTTTKKPAAETSTTEATDTTDDGGDDTDVTTTTEDITDDDAGDADKDAYVDALKGSLGEDGTEIFEDGQIDCIAGGFVDVLGVDELKDAGVSPEELAETNGSDFPDELGVDEDKANEMFDVYQDCDVDFAEVFKKAFSSGGEPLEAEEEACIEDLMTEDNIRRSLVAEILGEELEDDPLDALTDCVSFGPATDAPVATPSTIAVPAN